MRKHSDTSLTMQLCIHKFELNVNQSIPVWVVLSVDNEPVDELEINISSIYSLTENCNTLQVAIKDHNKVYGSFTMLINDLLALKPSLRKHWITLCEDSENTYMGDYTINDTSMPRVLVTYGVMKGDYERNLSEGNIKVPSEIQEIEVTVRQTPSPDTLSCDSDENIPIKPYKEICTETPKEKTKCSKFCREEAKLKKFNVECNEEQDEIMNNLKQKVCALAEENENLSEEVKELKSKIKEMIEKYQNDKVICALKEDKLLLLDKKSELDVNSIEKIMKLEEKFVEPENKCIELKAECKQKDDEIKEIKQKILELTQENNQVHKTNNQLQSEIESSKEKLRQIEGKLMELEQKSNRKVNELYKEKMSLQSQLEQLKSIKEETNSDSMLQKAIIEQSNNKLLRREFELKLQAKEYENEKLNDKLKEHNIEIEKLRVKLQEADKELIRRGCTEELLNEKDKVIRSLEAIINEYLAGNKGACKKTVSKFEFNETVYNVKDDKEVIELKVELAKKDTIIKKLKDQKDLIKSSEINNVVKELEAKLKEKELLIEELQKKDKLKDKLIEEIQENVREERTEVGRLKSQVNEKEDKIDLMLKDQEQIIEKCLFEREVLSDNMEQKDKEMEELKARNKISEGKLHELSLKLLQQNKKAHDLDIQQQKALNENEKLKQELQHYKTELEKYNNLFTSPRNSSEQENEADQIDKMFESYLNAMHIQVKYKKIGKGQYIIGAKKISVRIKKDRLVIRVGGGYMMIEDFLSACIRSDNQNVDEQKFKILCEGKPPLDKHHTSAPLNRSSSKDVAGRSGSRNKCQSRSPSLEIADETINGKALTDKNSSNTKLPRAHTRKQLSNLINFT